MKFQNRLDLQIPKTVVIAGGNSGVGKGVSLYLARSGVKKIIICGRDNIKGEDTVQQLKECGTEGYFVQADLSSFEGCNQLYEFCQERFFVIDGLVYAAGITDRGTIESATEDQWDAIFNINVKGAFFLVQKLLPLLRKSDKGSIVTICSFSNYCGRPELIVYNSSKAALVALTRSLANSLKEEKIRVNGINLGWTDTDNERKIQKMLGNSDHWLDDMSKSQPFGRLISPQDAAYLVEFLLSDRSMMMTGSIIDLHQKVRV